MSGVPTRKRKIRSDDSKMPRGLVYSQKNRENNSTIVVGPGEKTEFAKLKAKPTTTSGGKEAKASLDDLFGGISAAKKANKKAAELEKKVTAKEEQKKAQEADDDMGFLPSNAENRKKTEEGFNIYHEDELNMLQGGDSALCPFDCNCCF